jgi:tellurite resistance protein TerA
MSRGPLSSDSIRAASENKTEFSGHKDSAGIAGYQEDDGRYTDCENLSAASATKLVNKPENGFGPIHVGLSWNNIVMERAEGLLNRLIKKTKKAGVDLDLGCLYELKNGERGCIQAFGEKFGDYDKEPYIHLSGDERTGDAEGDDEIIRINGPKWDDIERVLIYCYIYEGPTMWAEIAPQLTISKENEPCVKITPHAHREDINICALAKIQNKDGHMHFTNHTEYFHDHAAMDRAFGFGLKWGEGQKDD